MPKVGYRFRPTEEELLEYYLYHKITQNPLLYEDGDCPVRDWDLYGSDEPWDIWNICGGNDLLEDKSLYFFTQLKRLSPSRFNRKIASGVWEGEDGAKPVLACGSSDLILGFRKRFRYENKTNPKEHGRWIMHEFTFNSSLLGQHSNEAVDLVLCRIKNKESEQNNEKNNLGKKLRKTKQTDEVTLSKKKAFGSKRKLKEVASPNSNTDQDGECFQNKRLRVENDAAFVQRCSCSTQQTVESEGEIVDSLPEDSTTFDVEKYSSSLDQILEHDGTEGHGDEGAQSNQLRGADGESIMVQQNHPTELPCSSDILQILEREMESLTEDSGTYDVVGYSSILKQILHCTEENGAPGVQNMQLRGGEEATALVQQNHPTELLYSNDIFQILEREMESLPEDSGTYDVEKYSSNLNQILHCTGENGDEGVQNKQSRRADEDTVLVQQNHPTELPCSNSIIQITESEGEMESLPDNLTFDADGLLSNLDEIPDFDYTECRDEVCVQSIELRGLKKMELCKQLNMKVLTSTALESLEEWAF